jgi:hypothetical protein
MLSSRACARRRFFRKMWGWIVAITQSVEGGVASLTRREGAIFWALKGPKGDHPAPPVHHQQEARKTQER